MDQSQKAELLAAAKNVLQVNDRGRYTVPAGDLYPHQWLWDSCFISIGLRHLDTKRAQTELESLVKAQWANGMLPHIIFDPHPRHSRDHNLWRSWLNPHAPNGIITSGLTQPPLLAEAVWRVGRKLNTAERRAWYARMLPHLVNYHQWLYRERGLADGLVGLLHPYESGLDNSPPWVRIIRQHAWPWWLRLIELSHLARLVNLVRRDVRHVPPGQRMSNTEAIAYWNLQQKQRSQAYDSQKIMKNPKLVVEDLVFNCIFIKANNCLRKIAKVAEQKLPEELLGNMRSSEQALDRLWDEGSGQFFSCSYIDDALIREPSIATLLPLYAGCINDERARHLVSLLKKRNQFGTNWPIPSVPVSSNYFDPLNYWQGPTWINMNWLIMEGLKNYGFKEEAANLRYKTLELVAKSGSNEYFNPLTGEPAGASNFSWTAALIIDLLN